MKLRALVEEISSAARRPSLPTQQAGLRKPAQSTLSRKLKEMHLEDLEQKFKELGVFLSPFLLLACMVAAVPDNASL
jgi:hypothetical protein